MLLLPPQAPTSLRGTTVTVELTVDSNGIVRDVTLRPPTGDGKFDAALRRDAREWRFRPGTDAAGRPVTKVFEVVFSF
jgi:TonB family protein